VRRRRVALALAAALALGGCESFGWGGIPDAELPAEPIAIHYRTSEQARRHAEAVAKAAEAGRPAGGGPQLVGSKAHLRADMNALGSFLAEALGLQPGAPGADRGRLALLDPRSGSLEVVASALPGSVPMAWSADHDRLLFAQSPGLESGDVQILEWSRSQDTVRRVTTGPPVHTQACYGPEGRVVVAAVEGRGEAARSWIRISQPGGRGPWRDLSPGPADHSPTCAADGAAVAFVRATASGRSEVWVVDAPFDAAPRRLVPGHHPRFSARAPWLLYTATRRAGPGRRLRPTRASWPTSPARRSTPRRRAGGCWCGASTAAATACC